MTEGKDYHEIMEIIKDPKCKEAYEIGKSHSSMSDDTKEAFKTLVNTFEGFSKKLSIIHNHFIVDKGKGINGIIPRIEVQTTKHNGRLRKLEAKYWIASGAIIIMGWIVGYGVVEIRDYKQVIHKNELEITKINGYFIHE